MIGIKLYKANETDMQRYLNVSDWCNENTAMIEDKGEYYEVEAIPAPTIEELKAAKLAEVDRWTAAKIVGGFVSNASGELVTYDSDKDTQITMQGIALSVNTPLFAEKYPDGCPVRGYPQGSDVKQIYMLNAEQVMRWCADLSIHIGTCKQKGWEKQSVIYCANANELNKITFE